MSEIKVAGIVLNFIGFLMVCVGVYYYLAYRLSGAIHTPGFWFIIFIIVFGAYLQCQYDKSRLNKKVK